MDVRLRGGVLLYIAAALNPAISILPTDAQSTDGFGTICCELNYNRSALPVLVVYRSPTASATDDSSLFKALEYAAGLREECLILGDFNGPNVDWDNYLPDFENSFEAGLIDVADDLFLHQHIMSPIRFRTGQNPSLLDLVFTKFPDSITAIEIEPPLG